jgi:tRNA (guanine-N7-)-methyltransferase
MSRSRPDLDVAPFLIEATAPDESAPIDWSRTFGNDRPVVIEVGSGKGLFLVNAATRHPDRNFFGIELSRKYARLAAERLASSGVLNARIRRGDARFVLARLVPESSVRAVHIYFPDPWWKKRHKKRRVFTETLVSDIGRVLEPGGELHIATDVEEYFGIIRTLVSGHGRFLEEPVAAPRDPEHALDYLTNFERKYRIEGRPIFRVSYSRTGTGS